MYAAGKDDVVGQRQGVVGRSTRTTIVNRAAVLSTGVELNRGSSRQINIRRDGRGVIDREGFAQQGSQRTVNTTANERRLMARDHGIADVFSRDRRRHVAWR